MTEQRKILSRQGFTLLEMLAVLGIIAVLASIAVVAMRGIYESNRRKQTRAMLGTLQSMLVEYDVATALKTQPSYMYLPGGTDTFSPTPTVPMDVWKDADPSNPPNATTGEQWLAAPGDVDSETNGPERTQSQAVLNTAIILKEMAKIPAVKNMLAQIPADQLLNITESSGGQVIGPVVLDGWNNPIIFVPRAGLGGVRRGEPPADYVVRSNRTYNPTAPADQTQLRNMPGTVRPFFASAGPDGNFGAMANGNAAGDDNLYSFEN
jgi:prepilin-type N-terminal cleavage/methylation domain-containing protein